jgi:hypothetical protein
VGRRKRLADFYTSTHTVGDKEITLNLYTKFLSVYLSCKNSRAERKR